jgi:tetratricopeptide (TPR) repeat protein
MIALLLLALQAPPDEAACLALVRKMEESVAKGDGGLVDRVLDADAVLDRALKDTPGDAKTKTGFREGVKEELKIGSATSKVVKGQKGTYTFLRLRPEGASRRALFRMVLGDNFNYHDFRLEAGPGGALRATDLHILLSSEWLSDTFRRAYVGMVAAEPGLLGRLSGKENESVESIVKIGRIGTLSREGKPAEALKLYASLPPEARKEKMALILRYQAAAQISPQELAATVADFEKAHPGDPALPVLSIGVHAGARRWDDALKALDAVDRSLGGDPYLNVQRSLVHLQAGAFDKAAAAAEKALGEEKGLPQAYWARVMVAVRAKDHAATVTWLEAVETNLGLKIGDLSRNKFYADFAQSAEYAEWMKKREKKE